MAHRSLIFAFLAVCLFYVIQASPMPQDGAQPAPGTDTITEIQAAAAKIAQAAQDGFNAVANNPTLKQIGQDTERLVREGLEASIRTVSDGLKQLAPKTQ